MISIVKSFSFFTFVPLLITMCLCLATPSYGQQEPPPTIVFKNYVSKEGKFSINYPVTWTLREKNRFDEPNSHDLVIYKGDKVPDWGYAFPRWQISFSKSNYTVANQTQRAFDAYGQTDLFTMNVIEPVNLTKYSVDGEQTGSFIYGMKDEDTDSTTGEQLFVTKHNGTLYTFTFLSPAEDFDSPEATKIREYMIESIKWN